MAVSRSTRFLSWEGHEQWEKNSSRYLEVKPGRWEYRWRGVIFVGSDFVFLEENLHPPFIRVQRADFCGLLCKQASYANS
jgi:hypothetical protein